MASPRQSGRREGEDVNRGYRFGMDAPEKGSLVRFWIFEASPNGGCPEANYRGWGVYLGNNSEGFMVRALACTASGIVGHTVHVRFVSGACGKWEPALMNKSDPQPNEVLPRYGFDWTGTVGPALVLMADGYWTPWHIAENLRTQMLNELRRCVALIEGEVPASALEVLARATPGGQQP
jgi:hypothetical protein